MNTLPPATPPPRALPAALRTIRVEVEALEALFVAMDSDLGEAFDAAARLVMDASGRVIVTGMGKSGLVGRKIAATLASTGTPAFFIHPGEASHGDLGMITGDDVVLALSWSGETGELADILEYCRRYTVPLIAVTSRPQSTLASHADLCLTLPLVQEACPNQLAPTSSTTMQATLGDALAVALIDMRGFSSEDFRIFHPKGRLGAKLLAVGDLMSTGDAVPRVRADETTLNAAVEMSQKRFGVTAVVDDQDRLIGAFTDGDLRRTLTGSGMHGPVAEHMSRQPAAITPDRLASEALAIMNSRNILQIFVCSADKLVGIVHLHDILRVGVA
jgi:arabinose-5-phosphate isomerase